MAAHFNLPNALTWLRIVLVPLLVVLFYLPWPWSDQAAGLLFAVAGITDAFDGYFARKLNMTSRLGAFLDPVADKLIVAVALVLLISKNAHWYLVLTACVIIGREIAISALREWMAEIGARGKVAVSTMGKIKTILQIVGLSMMLFAGGQMDYLLIVFPIYWIGLALIVVSAVLTLWSMILYLRAAWPDLAARS
ncbi:MAG TPA: CDP-diacylglycerol--glycerol-3-phosphate 3-phosphatidyltransferase [Steroidobacteraceae bacterium]|nr:CDP-diacylglycerol--glycerol-3-phosphate 3-phosphatidyltransferase [Steroidobacteraceae bacterium]